MRPLCHSLGHVKVFLTSAKSNDIKKYFCQVKSCTEIAFTPIYDITMTTEHFEIKNKDLRPL